MVIKYYNVKCALALCILFGCILIVYGLFSPIVNYPIMDNSKFYYFYKDHSYLLLLLNLISLLTLIAGKFYILTFTGTVSFFVLLTAYFDFTDFVNYYQANKFILHAEVNYFGWTVILSGISVFIIAGLVDLFYTLKKKKLLIRKVRQS